MKQNLFNKVWLRIGIIVAVMTTTFAGTAWAQEAYRTIDFANCQRSGHATNSGTTWTATNTSENFKVTLVNFNNSENNSSYWNYIACGRRGNAVVATITTGLIDKPITKVDLTAEMTANFLGYPVDYVNSIKLYTSADYSTWTYVDDFSDETGTSSVMLSSPIANRFYKIEVDCEGSSLWSGYATNFVHITKVVFNKATDDPNAVQAPTITGNPEPTFQTQTLVTISRPNGAESVQYSTDGGTTWQTFTSTSTTFTLNKTTTVKAKAIKGNKESEEVSKCFSLANDVVDCTWNLKAAPTGGTPTANEALWTDDYLGNHTGAIMTLKKGGSSTNVNFHIGNNTDGTYFYLGQDLTISPVEGYTIVSVEFTCGDGYADELVGNGWSNATTSTNGSKVTVTPSDGTQPICMVVTAETHVTGVKVSYAPIEQPYIEVADALNVTSAATSGTEDVEYHGLFPYEITTVEAFDENGIVSWITASLNDDGDLEYSIEANAALEARTATIHIQSKKTDNFVTVTQEAAIKVTIAWFGYSTLYYGEKNLKLPADVEAYTYKKGDVKMIESHYYGNQDVIPAGTAVVLKGTPGDYAFVETTADGVVDEDNELQGFDVATQLPENSECYYYVLSVKRGSTPENGGASTVGFYWNASDGGAFTSAAHKAYLALPKGSSVKSFYVFGEDDDPTGINNLDDNDNLNEAIYNLAGQRINKMQRGINIVNGKKILK